MSPLLGPRPLWTRAARQRQRARTQGAQASPRWRPFAPGAVRLNPLLSWWTQGVRRRIGFQRQIVELWSRELKALDAALTPGHRPGARWAGAWRRPAWGQGAWGNSDVAAPYDATEAAADGTTNGATDAGDVSTPVDDDEESGASASPASGPSDEDASARSVSHSVIFKIFRSFDADHHHDQDYFTEDLYPRAARVNTELANRNYGPDEGYAKLSSADVRTLYDRYVHHEALDDEATHDDDDEGADAGDAAPAKRPTNKDIVQAINRTYRAHKELTKRSPHYPYEEDVNTALREMNFKPVDADRIERVFDSDEAEDIATPWRKEESDDDAGERRPTNDDLVDAFQALYEQSGGPPALTQRAPHYPNENAVNRQLAKKKYYSVDADRIRRVFDSRDARGVAEKWRKADAARKR